MFLLFVALLLTLYYSTHVSTWNHFLEASVNFCMSCLTIGQKTLINKFVPNAMFYIFLLNFQF